MQILIIGDSFVEGVGAPKNFGWAYRLAKAMSNHKFTISGVGGDNIKKINDRLREYASQEFDLVILEVGLNDSRFRPSLKGHEIEANQFSTEIKKFVDALSVVSNPKFVFVGLTRVEQSKTDPYKDDKHYRNSDIDLYDELLKRLAREVGATYVNAPKLNDSTLNLFDGLHPSDEGHRLIFSRVAEALSSQLDANHAH